MNRTAQGEHGGEAYRVARALGIDASRLTDLGTNGNVLCADLTAAHVAAMPYPFEHYPDLEATVLREAAAAHEEVPADHVLAGNGSAELLWLALTALRPQRVLLLGPLFGEYERACRALGIACRVVVPRALEQGAHDPHGSVARGRPLRPAQTPRDSTGQALTGVSGSAATSPFHFDDADLARIAGHPADIAVFCTPNNPTGAVFTPVDRLLAAIQAPVVLVDNTYREFVWGEAHYTANAWQAYRAAADGEKRIIALHSLTKFFHCAGIRCGYAVGEPELLGRLAAVRAPWMVSTHAEHMGARLLRDIGAYRARLPRLRRLRASMRSALEATGAFTAGGVHEGTSFVTCHLRQGLQPEVVRERLLAARYLVRVCDNITGMPPGYLRMQVRAPESIPELFTLLSVLASEH